jgi:hypothetical protein
MDLTSFLFAFGCGFLFSWITFLLLTMLLGGGEGEN